MNDIYIKSPITNKILYNFYNDNGNIYLKSENTKLFNINDFITLLEGNIVDCYIFSPISNNKLFYVYEESDNIYICSPLTKKVLYILYGINNFINTLYIYIKSPNSKKLYKIIANGLDIYIYSPKNDTLLYIINNGMYLFSSHGQEIDLPNVNEVRGYCSFGQFTNCTSL